MNEDDGYDLLQLLIFWSLVFDVFQWLFSFELSSPLVLFCGCIKNLVRLSGSQESWDRYPPRLTFNLQNSCAFRSASLPLFLVSPSGVNLLYFRLPMEMGHSLDSKKDRPGHFHIGSGTQGGSGALISRQCDDRGPNRLRCTVLGLLKKI